MPSFDVGAFVVGNKLVKALACNASQAWHRAIQIHVVPLPEKSGGTFAGKDSWHFGRHALLQCSFRGPPASFAVMPVACRCGWSNG